MIMKPSFKEEICQAAAIWVALLVVLIFMTS